MRQPFVRRGRSTHPFVNHMEGLEGRRLLSVSLSHGLLRISGSDRNDKVTVFVDQSNAARLDVKMNNVVTQYNLADVTSIRVDGRGGDDRIDINQSNGAI